ncbi:hypothetical protein AB0F52_08910 [Amycolatopsis sp. NPDC024027]|uniref:hypothetical protein n=1 Tax=Amycolatopsis sp. NPDC024027 TaxID=3154327 RepID=UPI00340BE712
MTDLEIRIASVRDRLELPSSVLSLADDMRRLRRVVLALLLATAVAALDQTGREYWG